MNNKIKTTDIKLQRSIDAQPQEVFEAWLDHNSPGSPWFGVAKAIVNPPQVDGLFYSIYKMENREIAHYGRFVVLDKPRMIQHTWVSEATQGLESIVTITLEPDGDKTTVNVHHTNVPDDSEGRRHQQAWGFVLGKMSVRFSESSGL